jgi:hypothetical protein
VAQILEETINLEESTIRQNQNGCITPPHQTKIAWDMKRAVPKAEANKEEAEEWEVRV